MWFWLRQSFIYKHFSCNFYSHTDSQEVKSNNPVLSSIFTFGISHFHCFQFDLLLMILFLFRWHKPTQTLTSFTCTILLIIMNIQTKLKWIVLHCIVCVCLCARRKSFVRNIQPSRTYQRNWWGHKINFIVWLINLSAHKKPAFLSRNESDFGQISSLILGVQKCFYSHSCYEWLSFVRWKYRCSVIFFSHNNLVNRMCAFGFTVAFHLVRHIFRNHVWAQNSANWIGRL